MFDDIAAIAACLPGASLTAPPKPERVEGEIRVRIGPIAATFSGVARVERSPGDMSGRIVGIGNDRRSRSSTQGEIRYRLVPIEQGAATRIDLSIGYTVTGMLAQFGRPGLVQDLAARLIAEFAGQSRSPPVGTTPVDVAPVELSGMSLVSGLLRTRVVRGLVVSRPTRTERRDGSMFPRGAERRVLDCGWINSVRLENHMTRTFRIVPAIALAAAFLGGAADAQTIKIGVNEPLTAHSPLLVPTSSTRQDRCRRDQREGRNSRQEIELVIEDNKSNPTEAAAVAEKLITSDKVPVLMGAWGSSLTLAVMPKLMEYETPMVVETSSSGKITTTGNPLNDLPHLDAAASSRVRSAARSMKK